MTLSQFNIVVRKHAIKHYGGLSGLSRSLGMPSNYISRCISGERPYPDSLLLEVKFKRTSNFERMTKEEIEALEENQ